MKKVFSYLLLMAAVVAMPAVLTSCGDDEPETPENPETPETPENSGDSTPMSSIVGTWIGYHDQEGEYECFVLRADGTGIYGAAEIGDSGKGSFGDITYTYDETEKIFSINLHGEGYSETAESQITSITDGKFVMVVDDEDYTYVRQTDPQVAVVAKAGGSITTEWTDVENWRYVVESNSGSCYFDVKPVLLWHENLPPLTLQAANGMYEPIDFEVTGDNPYVLSVYFSANNTSYEKRSAIELRFANADNSISGKCQINIYQTPAR